MSAYSNPYIVEAGERLAETGFNKRSLEQLDLPTVQAGMTIDEKPVFYQVHGDLKAAKTILIDVLAYGVQLAELAQQVPLSAKQTALGDEYCVVGVQPYDPVSSPYTPKELDYIQDGDFKPMGDRVLTVLGVLEIRDDQELVLHGSSLGADVSAETSHLMLTNQSRGLRQVDRLLVVEYTRGKNYRSKIIGGILIASAFGRSGKELFDNILASDCLALFEANGIDPQDPQAKKIFDNNIHSAVLKNAWRDRSANKAGFMGAATNGTFRQIEDISSSGQVSAVRAGRTDRSLLCLPPFIEDLSPAPTLETFVEAGDHSAGNDIKRNVAWALRAAIDLPE